MKKRLEVNYPSSSQDNFSRGSFVFLEELRIPIFFRDLLTFTMVAHSILKNTQCIQIHIQQLFNQMYTFWLVSHYQDFLGLGDS